MGTAEFDLANGSVTSTRSVKIVDDGNGNPSEVNPSIDIDAVENQATANQNQPPDNPTQPVGPTAGGTNNEYTYTTPQPTPNLNRCFTLGPGGLSSRLDLIHMIQVSLLRRPILGTSLVITL